MTLIPEILHATATHLQAPDLLSCIQVSHLWYNTFLPQLWHTIDDRIYSWPAILPVYDSQDALGKQDETWLRAIFTKHGHLIRRLVVSWKILIDITSTLPAPVRGGSGCVNVQELVVLDVSENVTEEEEREERWHSNMIMGQAATKYRPGNPTAQVGRILDPALEGMFVPLKANDRTPEQQRRDWETVQRFWMLVRQNPGLTTLKLDGGFNRLCGLKDTQFVYEILGSLLHLKELENDFVALDRSRLMKLLPGLQTYQSTCSE
ncbi:hypothetical protein EC991_006354 [Linnemannia zychae]|nr:hypothetical protein EC991_006354 [Linnemannia zychae]